MTLLLAALISLTSVIEPADSVVVTYIGNEGFLIERSGKKVLVDALYRAGVSGYVVHTPALRAQLEQAKPPFDEVDIVLATHHHADHFNPNSVGLHLIRNRGAVFVTTPQAAEQMDHVFSGVQHLRDRILGRLPAVGTRDTVVHNDIRVVLLNLHHGSNRPIENLGFVVDLDGFRFLHVGDTESTPEEFALLNLAEMALDLVFVPYWFLAYEGWNDRFEQVFGDAVPVAMHMPGRDDPRDLLQDLGGFAAGAQLIRSKYERAIVPDEPLESFIFDVQPAD